MELEDDSEGDIDLEDVSEGEKSLELEEISDDFISCQPLLAAISLPSDFAIVAIKVVAIKYAAFICPRFSGCSVNLVPSPQKHAKLCQPPCQIVPTLAHPRF